MQKTIIIIPSRLGSTRFAEKVLVDIAGKSMVIRVLEQAKKIRANVKIFVATDHERVFNEVEKFHPGHSIMTKNTHESGTDRVFEAVSKIDPEGKFENVINLQGDLPCINPEHVEFLIKMIEESQGIDIATLGVPFADSARAENPNLVKIVTNKQAEALYFSRSVIPHGGQKFLSHVGLYGFKRKSLEKFVSLPVSDLEKSERLEQLRALENGMKILVGEVSEEPISIDTKEDLQRLLASF